MKIKNIFGIMLFILISCERFEMGACEWVSNKGTEFETFSCYPVDSESECNDHVTGRDESYYHASSTCPDLGYSKRPVSEVYFQSPDGEKYPGVYGYFASNDYDGSKPSYCTNSYQNPGVGVQLSSYCEGAYTYLCIGGYSSDSEEVSSYCNLYNAMNNIGAPACPYCK